MKELRKRVRMKFLYLFFRWFNFEKVVQALAAENVHYLKLDQLKDIIRKFCFIKNEDDVVTLLDYYHDIGKIVRHHNTVVLRAKWLIDIFKKLVTICPFDDSVRNKMSSACNTFRRTR